MYAVLLVYFLQLYRMNGDAAEQTVLDCYAGSHAVGYAAIMQGYSVICCEASNDQHSWGKMRMKTELTAALDKLRNCEFEMPLTHMLVHPDDVTKDVHEMRFLPKEELLQTGDHLVNGVDISHLRKRVMPLRVSSKTSSKT